MKWYLLSYKIKDDSGVLPSLSYDDKYIQYDYYQNLIKKNIFWNFDEPIFLKIEDKEEGVSQSLYDVMHWGAGKPMTQFLICSESCRKSIDQLEIPLHTFYPVKTRRDHQFHNYWMLHYIFDIYNFINISSSTFYLHHFGSDKTPVKIFPKGSFNSLTDLQQIAKEELANKLRINPLRLVFNDMPPYDIWSLYGQHIISAKAMLLFEEAGITGIDMIPLEETEWKNLEIVMKPTDTITVSK